MAAAARLASPFGISHQTCVVSDDPIISAVTLVPCMCKANKAAAEFFFGPMIHAYTGPVGQQEGNPNRAAEGKCKKEGKSCPRCYQEVTAYYPDDQFQSAISAEGGNALSPRAQALHTGGSILPATKFRRDSDEIWESVMEKFQKNGKIELSFVNINDNALLSQLYVKCEKGKSPSIHVQTVHDDNKPMLHKTLLGCYLAAARLLRVPQQVQRYDSTNLALLHVVEACSTIPEPELSFIKRQYAQAP